MSGCMICHVVARCVTVERAALQIRRTRGRSGGGNNIEGFPTLSPANSVRIEYFNPTDQPIAVNASFSGVGVAFERDIYVPQGYPVRNNPRTEP